MSVVSSRVGLTHRATIERNQGTTDSFGSPGEPDWQTHLSDVPCRAWTEAIKSPIDVNRTIVYEDRRIIIPLGEDVTEADRVATVTTPAGDELFPGPMKIQGVLAYRDHLELVVEEIK